MAQTEENPFLELAKQHFKDLIEHDGFVITAHGYNAEFFGNAFVTLQSAELQILLERDKGVVLLAIGRAGPSAELYDLTQLVAFLDPKSNWSYRSPDENNQLFSSTEWKIGEVKRVFDLYRTQLLDADLYSKKNKLRRLMKARYVRPVA